MSEDISYRQRRYLISMGVRVVAFLLAVFLFHGIWRFIAAAIALVVPYFAVVFANGGREPDNARGVRVIRAEPAGASGTRGRANQCPPTAPGAASRDRTRPTGRTAPLAADTARDGTARNDGDRSRRHPGEMARRTVTVPLERGSVTSTVPSRDGGTARGRRETVAP